MSCTTISASGAGALELRVSDAGAGFDPDVRRTRGIGLPSMRERLRSRVGRLEIDSTPSRGTTLRALLPTRAVAERSGN